MEMNEKNFEVFARWVRQQCEYRNASAAHSARWLSETLATCAERAEAGKAEVDMGSLYPRVISELESARVMAEILEWVEMIEREEDN